MEQSQVLDSWQHAVPVRWESSRECSPGIQAQCLAVQKEGVSYFSGCYTLLPAGHCWGMDPALAVWLLDSEVLHLLLPILLVAVSPALVTQQPSGL